MRDEGRSTLRAPPRFAARQVNRDCMVLPAGVGDELWVQPSGAAELRLDESDVRTLLDHAGFALCLIDFEGRCVAANGALARILGRPTRSTAGLHWKDLSHPDDVEAGAELLAELRLGRLQRCRRELRLIACDGATVWVRLVATMAPRTGDGPPLALVMLDDITDRKREEDALVQARDAAERASRGKSQFLVSLSHELRAPLNSILGFSEIIRDHLMGPDAQEKYAEYAGNIHRSGHHLLDLINDILDIAKIESGKMSIEPTQFELPALLAEMVHQVAVAAAEAGLSVTLDCPGGLAARSTDQRALKQILFNLLSNAIKYTRRGGRIVLEARAEADGIIALSVIDSGIGIAQKDLGRLMKPFEQADNRYNRTGGGTGLGLWLVKSLVELHGGRLELQSELGRGTTVTVRLPPIPAAAGATVDAAL
ncbi:MAG: PAS domain S-box protein [Azospirillum sp.]|nr:PAS domain S-box protein [Azospirillum sp.]